jgi:predicted ATP-dependent endonuclease of OLD family
MEYVEKHYPEKCWVGLHPTTCRALPLKFSRVSPLSNLTFRHTSQIEYFEVESKFNSPNEGGWDDYKTILALCPNLKGIHIVEKRGQQMIDLLSSEQNVVSSENQQIWNDRIKYLNSRNIEVMNLEQCTQQLENPPKKLVFRLVSTKI